MIALQVTASPDALPANPSAPGSAPRVWWAGQATSAGCGAAARNQREFPREALRAFMSAKPRYSAGDARALPFGQLQLSGQLFTVCFVVGKRYRVTSAAPSRRSI